MKYSLPLAFVLLLSLLAAPAMLRAEDDEDLSILVDQVDEEDAEAEADPLEEALELGAGVHHMFTDKKGNISSCVTIGSSSISRSLSKSKAIEIARKRARIDAVRQFVKFLNEDVSIFETESNEYIIAEEGSAAEDALTSSEESKSISKGTDEYTSSSKALVRGLEYIGLKQDGDGRTLYLVYGWSAENAAAAKKLSDKSQAGAQSGGKTGGTAASGGGDTDNAGGITNAIEDRKVISSRANKYFRKD